LSRAARYAAAHGFTVLATTLASSRWKSLEQVDAAGMRACEAVNRRLALPSDFSGRWEQKGPKTSVPSSISGRWKQSEGTYVTWWAQNWRVCGLQPRRSEIIREQNFYNQDFCGCEFSIRNK
ncbi:MAG: epoxyqueuosine reductase QueH, partial [Bacteroidales bacterium]|nr:epoxyqueuosine reductase QueH [Bacteroidales bacterium]